MKRLAGRAIALIVVWACVLGVGGVYFTFLKRVAPEILFREGQRNHGDLFALAVADYDRFRRLQGTLSEAERIRLLDEAINDLRNASDQRPESRDYVWFLGRVLYARACEETPPNPALLTESLGLVERSWDLADRKWKKPGMFLAQHHLRTGRPDRAEPILEHLLAVHSEDPEVYNLLLSLLVEDDRRQEAIVLLLRKRERLSLSTEEIDRLAYLYLQEGDDSSAIQALDKLVAGGAAESRQYLLLAGALRAVGDLDEAFRILREFARALGPRGNLQTANAYGLPRYPKGLFPPLAYLVLEGELGPLP